MGNTEFKMHEMNISYTRTRFAQFVVIADLYKAILVRQPF